MDASRHSIRSTIQVSCPFGHCDSLTANGYGCRSNLPDGKIWLRCWEVSVGRTKLYLLDTNDFANTAAHRGITSELYGGDAEMRLKQEIVLGIGGWRLLRALGLRPEVCHLNEGHAAFATLERARSLHGGPQASRSMLP